MSFPIIAIAAAVFTITVLVVEKRNLKLQHNISHSKETVSEFNRFYTEKYQDQKSQVISSARYF